MDYTIETHSLRKIYKRKIVVNDVSIHVKKGEIYGFVGLNGAGKSTLMKMLLNLIPSDSGEIVIFDKKSVKDDFEMLKRIGSIIENPYFYDKLICERKSGSALRIYGILQQNHIGDAVEMCRAVK